MFNFLRKFQLIPNEPREADLFVLGLTFLLLFFFLNDFRYDLLSAIQWEAGTQATKIGGIFYAIVMLVISAPVVIYIALTHRSLSRFEKFSIRFFFVVVNMLIAIGIGIHSYRYPDISSRLLAIWQFFHAYLLLLYAGKKHLGDLHELPKSQMQVSELLVALPIIGLVLWWGNVHFWYWAVTFSAVLFFWQLADSSLRSSTVSAEWYTTSPVIGMRKLKKI